MNTIELMGLIVAFVAIVGFWIVISVRKKKLKKEMKQDMELLKKKMSNYQTTIPEPEIKEGDVDEKDKVSDNKL